MRRSALWSAFVLLVATALYGGCTQNFDQFTSGSGTGGSSSASTGAGNNGGSGGCSVPSDCGQPGTCETIACENHQCKTSAQSVGTACVSGSKSGVCDSAKQCVDCNVPDDCGDPGDCLGNTCDGHKCGTKPIDENMPCGTGGTLECKGGVCKGCTDPMQCNSTSACKPATCDANMQCGNGIAAEDTPCTDSGGSFCDPNGNCVACTKDAECPGANPPCKTFTCTAAFTCMENDAASGTTCSGGFCDGAGNCGMCNNPGDCGNDPCLVYQCNAHVCSSMPAGSGTMCGGGKVCDGADHCVECVNNSQCTPPQTCGGGGMANKCGCTATTCNALNQTCGTASDGCSGTLMCDDTMKNGNETDVDCGGATSGPGNHCPTRCAKGKMCSAGSDCVASASNCVDGVCCNSACGAICMACNLAGSVGTCSPLTEGTNDGGKCDDTHGGCANGGKCTCNGAGMCLEQANETCTMNSDCASGTCQMPQGKCM